MQAGQPSFDWIDDPSIGLLCVTFVRRVDPVEAMRRIGADVSEVPQLTAAAADRYTNPDGIPDRTRCPIRAHATGDWAVLIELDTTHGGAPDRLARLSLGTEAVSLLDTPEIDLFQYAENGDLVTAFEPTIPESMSGSQPDRFLHQMRSGGCPINGVSGGAVSRFQRSASGR